MVKIIVNTVTKEKRLIVLKDNKVEEIIVEQPKEQSLVGNIYYGTVTDVVPGMNAAFINIGVSKNGFLHINDLPNYQKTTDKQRQSITNLIHEGEKILVQVTKDGTLTKGPRLTGLIEFDSNLLVYIPYGKYVAVSKKLSEEARTAWRSFGKQIKKGSEGLIIRTDSEAATKEEVLGQLQQLREEYYQLVKASEQCTGPTLLLERDTFFARLLNEIKKYTNVEVIVDEIKLRHQLSKSFVKNDNITVSLVSSAEQITYSGKIDNAINRSLRRLVWLENGASIVFDQTEALTVIDVNTGKYVGKGSLRQTVLKVNKLALKEIARQIRLRNLGGIILIDFINMKHAEDRNYILKLAKAELGDDEKRTTVVGFTSLGILQLTRKRTTPSLVATLTSNCPVCNGSGKVLSSESVAFQLERTLWEYRNTNAEAVLVEATEDVIKTFSGENDAHRQRLENVLYLKIFFLKSENCQPSFSIRQFGSKSEISDRFNSLI